MPLNMKNISPHLFSASKSYKPYCYNCTDKNNCCEKQQNKNKYPKLKSPDYAFANDIILREQNKSQLNKLGLSVHYVG